jgi:hypothetical protein
VAIAFLAAPAALAATLFRREIELAHAVLETP